MTKLKRLHHKSSDEPAHRQAHGAQDHEVVLALAIAEARSRAGLTQAEVALRMQTSQSNIARMEAGRTTPSTRTLERFAEAVGARLKISFPPVRSR